MTPRGDADPVPKDTGGMSNGLSAEELGAEQASELPDREAMTVLSVGGLEGGLPPPGVLDTLPDAGLPVDSLVGIPSDEVVPESSPVGPPPESPILDHSLDGGAPHILGGTDSGVAPGIDPDEGITGFPDIPTSPMNNGGTLV